MKIQVQLTAFEWKQIQSWLSKAGDKDQTALGKKLADQLPQEKAKKKK